MNDTRAQNRRCELITWGALFLWVGVRDLLPGLPAGTGPLGIGLILIGVNAARRLRDIPINAVSTALGLMAALLGSVVLFLSLQGIAVDLPFFSLLLVFLGVIFLVQGAARVRGASRAENG